MLHLESAVIDTICGMQSAQSAVGQMEWAFEFKCPFEKQIISFKMAIRVFETGVQGIRKLCPPEELFPNEEVYDIEPVRWDVLEASAH